MNVPANHAIKLNGKVVTLTQGESTPLQHDIIEAVKRGASRAMFIETYESHGALNANSAISTRLVDQTIDTDAVVDTEEQAYIAEGTRAYVSDQELIIVTETRLMCEHFGIVEDVKLIRNKNLVLVHFTSIAACVRAVTALSKTTASQLGHSSLPYQCLPGVMPGGFGRNNWSMTRKVRFGRDRCDVGQDRTNPLEGNRNAQRRSVGISDPYDNIQNDSAVMGFENNTIYLGGLHPETTCEEICNAVRGKSLSFVRDRH
jgi:hypothetical protein